MEDAYFSAGIAKKQHANSVLGQQYIIKSNMQTKQKEAWRLFSAKRY